MARQRKFHVKKHITALIVGVSCCYHSYGQSFPESLFPDSIITKFHIKQITSTGSSDTTGKHALWITTEKYNTAGERTHHIRINKDFHRSVYVFSYDKPKNRITADLTFYDYNPHRTPRKKDTMVTKSRYKFDYTTHKSVNDKRRKNERWLTHRTYDSKGRLTETRDTIKCGYSINTFTYDSLGNLSDKKEFITRHNDSLELTSHTTFIYNQSNQCIRSIEYSRFNHTTHKPNHETITVYRYQSNGLLADTTSHSSYLGLDGAYTTPTGQRYIYTYEYY